MDKFLKIIGNQYVRLGVSILSLGYTAGLFYVAWIVLGYFIEPTNRPALITTYIFINVIFLGIMIYTRQQIFTRFCALVNPLLAFAILMLSFGRNWEFVIPPIIICVITFFITKTSETNKVVIGTIYLILYVVGVLVYLTFQRLMGNISLMEVDLSTRSTTYKYSPDEQYRIVTYVEPEKDSNRTVSFYLEESKDDIILPFVECKKVTGCIHLITSNYLRPATLEWKNDNDLYIDGRQRKYDFNAIDEDFDIGEMW